MKSKFHSNVVKGTEVFKKVGKGYICRAKLLDGSDSLAGWGSRKDLAARDVRAQEIAAQKYAARMEENCCSPYSV